MSAPQPTRNVPGDWIELTDHLIDDIKIGACPGWVYVDGAQEAVAYTSPDGVTRAWAIRRGRVLGSPIPVVGRPEL